jgi:hypothetical protein
MQAVSLMTDAHARRREGGVGNLVSKRDGTTCTDKTEPLDIRRTL